MRNVVFYVGLAVIATALVLLVLFDDGGSTLGMDSDRFASLAQLTAVALLVGSALLATRHRVNMRLWHAAVWLAAFVALLFGYTVFRG